MHDQNLIPEGCPLSGINITTIVGGSTMDKFNEMKTEMSLLKHDISIFDKYFAKIDVTVSRLGEVIEQINRLVCLHDERIESYHQDTGELKKVMDDRRKETFDAINGLETKITDQGEKLTKSFDDLRKEIGSNLTQSNARIKKLELWKYLVLGGAIVIGFLVTTIITTTSNKYINPNSSTPPAIVHTIPDPTK